MSGQEVLGGFDGVWAVLELIGEKGMEQGAVCAGAGFGSGEGTLMEAFCVRRGAEGSIVQTPAASWYWRGVSMMGLVRVHSLSVSEVVMILFQVLQVLLALTRSSVGKDEDSIGQLHRVENCCAGVAGRWTSTL